MSIYVFSRPVQSGKTTELLNWCKNKKSIGGILMPDINGARKIFDVATKDFFDIECIDTENTKEPITSVGRFHFYTSSFELANSILLAALAQKPDWLVIDEVGRLELGGKGFYKSIVQVVNLYNQPAYPINLLITVRDSLLGEVISFFGINNCHIIHDLELLR
jgi:nucleoside-triphosphatase THEP1